MERRAALSRNTPLVAKKGLETRHPLQARSTLGQGGGLKRNTELPRQVPQQRPKPKPKSGDDIGAPIPRGLADYIVDRAEGCCDWCGRYCLNGYYSRQHRTPRGMGGRRNAHSAANLVLLCGSANSPGGCHLKAEHDDIPGAQAAGFRLKPGEKPEEVPILRHGRELVYPTAEGWVAA